MHILPNISRIIENQAMKFGQLIEYNKRNVFHAYFHTENKAGRLILDLFLFFKKVLYMVKASGLQFGLTIF